MKSTIITTTNHNVGDDFVREGIMYLLDSHFSKSGAVEYELIHKHSPISVVSGLESIRSTRISNIVEPFVRTLGGVLPDKIKSCELLVQSGAPIYWCHEESHCGNNEWFSPLVENRYLKNRSPQKFINLAGGSCQTYYSDGSEFLECDVCSLYVKKLFECADLTIVRDKLARTILSSFGLDARVFPCTSIFAKDRLGVKACEGEYVVLNYMQSGGHYTFGQEIDSDNWARRFVELYHTLSKSKVVIVSCHNQIELDIVSRLLPDAETFLVPNDYQAFMGFYAKAEYAIVNRVHAGFMVASLGKPVVVIGTDSRARMIEELGLKSYFVEDVPEWNEIIEYLEAEKKSYEDKIESIRESAKIKYLDAIGCVL